MAVVVATNSPASAWDELSAPLFFSIVGLVVAYSAFAGVALLIARSNVAPRIILAVGLVAVGGCIAAKLWLLLAALCIPLIALQWERHEV
jgi:hypothetical protein